MATPTRTIGTTFTVNGLQAAAAGIQSFAARVRAAFQGLRAPAAGSVTPATTGLQRLAQVGRRVFAELRNAAVSTFRAMTSAEARATASIQSGLKKVTWWSLTTGAKRAFQGLIAGAALVALKIAAIGTAAYKSSEGISEMLNTISKDSRRLGIKPDDLSVLRFGFQREGVDADETLQSLSDIGNEFKNIRDQILAADTAFQKTKDWNLQKALAGGTVGSVFAAYQSNAAAASSSFAGIRERQDQIRAMIEQSGDRPGDSDDRLRLQLVEEYKQLEAAKLQLQNSLGPQGQALFTLQKYGLNIEEATKGGIEGLYALGDAFKRVEDPATRLRISMQLFGEDAGAKMVTVLSSGREGIEQYRREMERLGGVVTQADADRGAAADASKQRLHMAIQGLRLEIDRELTPLIIESQDQLSEWVADHRTTIAELVKLSFIALRNFITDVAALINGKRDGFKTPWLNSLMLRIKEAKALIADFQAQIQMLQAGQQSDWPWLNAIYAQIMRTYEGFKVLMGFASDAFAVITGGSAETYKWMESVRDAVVAFAAKFADAWKMFTTVLSGIHTAMQKFLDLFGLDLTTTLLFLGLLRISGVLGGIITVVQKLWSAGAWIWGAVSSAGAAASVAGATGAAASAGAVGAAASAAGGAAATGGLLARIGALRAALLAIPGSAAIAFAGIAVAVGYAFKGLLDDQQKFADRSLANAVTLARLQAEPQLRQREWTNYAEKMKDPEFRIQERNLIYKDWDKPKFAMTENETMIHNAIEQFLHGKEKEDAQEKARLQRIEDMGKPTKTIAIDLSFNGQKAKMIGDAASESLWEQIQRNQRMGD